MEQKPDHQNHSGIELAGLTLHRVDRVVLTSGKLRGGGLAIYTNDLWFCNATMVSKTCSFDLKSMTVKCRPFFAT